MSPFESKISPSWWLSALQGYVSNWAGRVVGEENRLRNYKGIPACCVRKPKDTWRIMDEDEAVGPASPAHTFNGIDWSVWKTARLEDALIKIIGLVLSLQCKLTSNSIRALGSFNFDSSVLGARYYLHCSSPIRMQCRCNAFQCNAMPCHVCHAIQ